MCQHQPRCPEWPAPDHLAARIVADQPGQGWSLLCNGVIEFDDGGELLPDGGAVTPTALICPAPRRFQWPGGAGTVLAAWSWARASRAIAARLTRFAV